MLIVVGMHRSGTTFLGNLIGSVGGYKYLHEPFNRDFGVKNLDVWYPYLHPNGEGSAQARDLLSRLESLELSYKTPVIKVEPRWKTLARKIIHSKSHLDFIVAKMTPNSRTLLVKDPSMVICASWLAAQNPRVKIIYLVRHPCAVYQSVIRMGWSFNDEDLWSQPRLVEDILEPMGVPRTGAMPIAFQVAWLWRILYTTALHQAKELPQQQVLVLRHEDLSRDPLSTAQTVLAFAGRSIDKRSENFIKKNMMASKVDAIGTKLHDFKRDSKTLATAWQRKDDQYYPSIADICGNLLRELYPEPDFHIKQS